MLRITGLVPGRKIKPAKTTTENPSKPKTAKAKSKTANAQTRPAETPRSRGPSNQAMELALKAAGLTIPPSPSAPPTVTTKPAHVADKRSKPPSPTPARKAAKKAATKQKQKPKAKKRIVRAQRPKVPVAIAVARADAAAAKARARNVRKVSRDDAHLADLRRQINAARRTTRPEDWWARKRDDLLSFAKDIRAANFRDLVERWKDCQSRLAKVDADETKADRREVYDDTLTSIEAEWLRRSALHYSKGAYFDWPTTNASPGTGSLGSHQWVAEGMLSYLGYRVGQSAELSDDQRQALLRRIFKIGLPPLESPAYLREWGSPSSPDRLRKMAHSIASFARLAKQQKQAQKHEAVAEWERDLKMLREEFYVEKFGFAWPSI